MSTLKYSNDSVNLLDIMCRSCLVSSDNMKQIFSDNESEDLIFSLSTCGGIKVSKSDGLPSALCHECLHELQQAFSFRTKCQNSNKILYDWLATQHTEKGESVAADNSNILIFCLSKEKIGSPEPSDTKENNALLDSTITSIENVLPILSKTKEEDTLFCDYACKTNESFLNSSLEISKSPAQESSKLSDDDLPLIHVLQKLGKNVTKKPTKEKTEIKKIVKRNKSNNRERCNSLSERDSSIEYRVANNSCYICSENFPTLDSLNAHKTVHYFYKCVKCKTRFKSMQEFRSHKCSAKQNKTNSQMNTKVKNRDSTSSIDVRSCKKIFWCTVCERGLTCGRSLKYHLRSHTGEKPHLCMVCGKTFREQRSLDNHVRAVHTCEKKFVCAFCPKAFSVSGKKRQHERTHTGEKPYQCPVCCRLFAARSTLNNHVRRHTHEIKFPCKVVGCGQGFYSFSTYQRHMWSHSGERPYQCTLCPKAYLSGQNLRSHTRAAHLQLRDQVCHLCKKEFTERSTLNRHIRSIHKSEPKVNKPVAVFGFPDESPCTLEGTTHSPVEDAVHQDFSDVT